MHVGLGLQTVTIIHKNTTCFFRSLILSKTQLSRESQMKTSCSRPSAQILTDFNNYSLFQRYSYSLLSQHACAIGLAVNQS